MTDVLREHEYVTLKVFVSGNPQAKNEEKFSGHLKTIKPDHAGGKFIRTLRDSFELLGEKGSHVCLVNDALGVTLKQLRELSDGEKLALELGKPIIYHVQFAFDYLHSQAKVVHTGTVLVAVLIRLILIIDLNVQEKKMIMSIADKKY